MPNQIVNPESFVELDRSFHEIALDIQESNTLDLDEGHLVGSKLFWADLLTDRRTVILSEAGSGKTAEIRQAAKRLRAENKTAFFLRLEHVTGDFEGAFEVGTFEEFEAWLASPHEAWLLLDSVDEARLRSPADFELAIRKVARRIQNAFERAHIILTGRTSAWRAKTDLHLCEQHLPLAKELKRISKVVTEEGTGDYISDSDLLSTESSTSRNVTSRGFRIVTLDNLSAAQIEVFARRRGVVDTKALIQEIERTEAQPDTKRPQDLEELIQFWVANGRVGSRLERMQNSIQRRLQEPRQSDREAYPLAANRARAGARLIAAATVMGREPIVQVPDGSYNTKGIPVQTVLPDWDDRDQATLLSRPIFDDAIYGTVRFHHRSVREFLTAEWLNELLKRTASRRSVEALLFRNQYGIEVVVPAMRPVLPWLALMDEHICERIISIAPEVLFESGDPTALPVSTRKMLLAKICKALADEKSGRSVLEYAAAQRFGHADLAEDICKLLRTYADNEEVVSFLVRMIWIGRLTTLQNSVKAIAISPTTPQQLRIVAIRALHVVCTAEDIEDLRQKLRDESPSLGRDLVGELISISEPSASTTEWVLGVLRKVEEMSPHRVDDLSDSLARYVQAAHSELLPQILVGLDQLLSEAPFIDRGICDVSQKNVWMMKAAALAAEQLIVGRHIAALDETVLNILQKLKAVRDGSDDLGDIKTEFSNIVPKWPELNRKAFWHDVHKTRNSTWFAGRKSRLINYWQASPFGAHWVFGAEDFDYVVHAISTLVDQDDKLVALSLAFEIYSKARKPATWGSQLNAVVKGNPALEERLQQLLNPPVTDHELEELKWKKRAVAQKKREQEKRAKWREFVQSNLELIRAPKLDNQTDISKAQWDLHEILRSQTNRSNRWTVGRWRELVPEFGEAVAIAYRQGVVSYWRKYCPKLRSEGAPDNSTPLSVIFGLSGLDIEAAETLSWPSNLNEDEVKVACRYAFRELNGFPVWFPKLFDAFPMTVGDFLLSEIGQEIATESSESDSNYLLSDVSWSGQWCWERLAPSLFKLLQDREIANVSNLGNLLKIVQGSLIVDDNDLAKLAEKRAQAAPSADFASIWFAAWVGVSPEQALPALRRRLASIKKKAEQAELAMKFVTRLIGGRLSSGIGARPRYRSPSHLKSLYLLMHKYIRATEDIDRIGGGVYSPGLRDNAQDSRNALFNLLREIPGKESYIALMEIAKVHPNAGYRPWIKSIARSKAEADSDLTPWSPSQVRDFHEHLDRTPVNHRELAELVNMRLLDLKDDLENGDESISRILQRVEVEAEMRNFLARELREKALGRYSIPQEEELADGKRPDLRFHGNGFDAPVPVELKLAEKWTGPQLFERLENQLAGDYLRDNRTGHGFFVLVNRKKDGRWDTPSGARLYFDGVIQALMQHWQSIAARHPHIEDITVVGIDLSKRFVRLDA